MRLNCVRVSTPWNSMALPLEARIPRAGQDPRCAGQSTPAECGLALLAPRSVALGLVLGQLERGEAVEIHEGGVREIGNVEPPQERFLREACRERRQRRDVRGDLERR